MPINFNFKDELGTNMNSFTIIKEDGTSYNVIINRNANITQQGTPLNATNLNAIINAINNIENGNVIVQHSANVTDTIRGVDVYDIFEYDDSDNLLPKVAHSKIADYLKGVKKTGVGYVRIDVAGLYHVYDGKRNYLLNVLDLYNDYTSNLVIDEFGGEILGTYQAKYSQSGISVHHSSYSGSSQNTSILNITVNLLIEY